MRKNLYLIILSCSLVSCYTYQTKRQTDIVVEDNKTSKKSTELAVNTSASEKGEIQSKNVKPLQQPIPFNVQEQITSNNRYKIDVDGKTYKIIADKWEGDSLVAHYVNNPNMNLKFHKNQINNEKISERRFSKPLSDIITVAAYAGIGIGIWSLLR
ncbi:hypothetical protein PGH12_06425 [Chryseobacterium wangxinyae]|uniref:hypothetical protein n=1 Tax=Chryseobacterium sp. CY350 TaxID=2997336 RepID=UPI00226E105F|nr:hypothetical protein [Chryseobacterium sp. CY350]MCY0976785.1 hypothetical protein [Chryseobacterium sp. CY350]WBZ96786.1 hypothetical protein PGH12_06425 [Chryseobacterium sp. CY350]